MTDAAQAVACVLKKALYRTTTRACFHRAGRRKHLLHENRYLLSRNRLPAKMLCYSHCCSWCPAMSFFLLSKNFCFDISSTRPCHRKLIFSFQISCHHQRPPSSRVGRDQTAPPGGGEAAALVVRRAETHHGPSAQHRGRQTVPPKLCDVKR